MITEILSARHRRSSQIKMFLTRHLGKNAAAWIHSIRYLKVSRLERESEMQLVKRFCDPGTIAIDVGANGGDWTLRMSKAVGLSGRVLAFEADPYYALVTERALRWQRLKNVTFYPFGLSSEACESRLVVDLGDGLRTSGLGFVDSTASPEDSVPVQLKRLDDVINEARVDARRISLVKIDVEGHEAEVVTGAMSTLALAQPIVIAEIGSPGGSRQGETGELLRKLLQSLSYSEHVHCADFSLRSVSDPLAKSALGAYNRVFIPDRNYSASA